MSACGLTVVNGERTIVQCTSHTDPNLREKTDESTEDSRILLGKRAGTKVEPYTSNDKTNDH